MECAFSIQEGGQIGARGSAGRGGALRGSRGRWRRCPPLTPTFMRSRREKVYFLPTVFPSKHHVHALRKMTCFRLHSGSHSQRLQGAVRPLAFGDVQLHFLGQGVLQRIIHAVVTRLQVPAPTRRHSGYGSAKSSETLCIPVSRARGGCWGPCAHHSPTCSWRSGAGREEPGRRVLTPRALSGHLAHVS